MEKLPEKSNWNPVCAKCNGLCCKRSPCLVAPEEFDEITEEIIIEKINQGFCIDYWEGDFSEDYKQMVVYFMRPRMKDYKEEIYHAGWSGECIFFVDNKGCSLSWENRPSQGRALVPDPKLKMCKTIDGYRKKDIVERWAPYSELLSRVVDRLI